MDDHGDGDSVRRVINEEQGVVEELDVGPVSKLKCQHRVPRIRIYKKETKVNVHLQSRLFSEIG